MEERDKYIYAISAITCVVVLVGKWVLNRDSTSKPTQVIKAVEQVSENRGISKGNPSPFGIEIGKSTKDEIKSKFRVIKERRRSKYLPYKLNWKNYTVFCLDPKDFSSKEFPVGEVELIFDQNGRVVQLHLVYNCIEFLKLCEVLSKKYKFCYSNEENTRNSYTCNNIYITAEGPQLHWGLKMFLTYATEQFIKESTEDDWKQLEEEQKRQEAELQIFIHRFRG